MDTITDKERASDDVCEVRITSGLEPSDVEAILNLAGASGLFKSDAMLSAEDMAWDSAYGDGNEAHTFLRATVLEAGLEKTIGFICHGPIPNRKGIHELYAIAVTPEFQRMGIGKALIAEMKRQIVRADGICVFLETDSGRAYEGARQFYESTGFIQECRFHKNFIPDDGGIVYGLNIEVEETDDQHQ